MATLDIGIDTRFASGQAQAAVRESCSGWRSAGLRLVVLASIFANLLPMPSSDRHGHAGSPGAAVARALARHRRAWARRTGAADFRCADFTDSRSLRAGDRNHHRRLPRNIGRLFSRPLRIAGGRQHGRIARLSAAGIRAGRDRLSRAIDSEPDLHARLSRHSRFHARRPRGNPYIGASGNSSSPRTRSAHRMPASCCTNCCRMCFCRCSPSSCSASPSPSWSKGR